MAPLPLPADAVAALALALARSDTAAVSTMLGALDEIPTPVASYVGLLVTEEPIPGVVLERVGDLARRERNPWAARQAPFAGLTFEAEQAVYRALYAANAAQRIARATDKFAAGQREQAYYKLHQQAEVRRDVAYRAVQAMARLHGPILSWRAVLDDATTPECRAAHGHNFDARQRPFLGYPGTLHGGTCRCTAGPPLRNATLIGSREFLAALRELPRELPAAA